MTDKTELSAEEQAKKEQQEAEAGFAAGFKAARGEHDALTPAAEGSTDDEPTVSTPQGREEGGEQEATGDKQEDNPQEDQPAEAPPDEWEGVPVKVREALNSLTTQLNQVEHITRSTQGRVSSLQSAMSAGRKAAQDSGGEQPSEAQVEAAMETPEDWKKFEKEYPEFAGPISALMKARKSGGSVTPKDLDTLREEVAGQIGFSAKEIQDRAEERALVRMKYPTWRADVKTPAYQEWIKQQPEEMQSLRKSQYAEDAITLLDAFYAAVKPKAANPNNLPTQKKQQQERRLRANVEPKGTPVAASTGITDEQAFLRGFKNARGR